MILEEETFKEFGYHSYDLTPKSNRKILVTCDDCGKIRELCKYAYHSLCKSCVKTGARHPLFGKHHSEKTKQKMRDARKNIKIPNTYTIPERIFIEMCKKFNLPFHYVGDSSLWIGEKNGKKLNPDFIEANGKKIVVEIFGDYWHSPLLNRSLRENANLNYRKEHYKRQGWNSIFLWESDLKRNDAEQFVLNELKKQEIT